MEERDENKEKLKREPTYMFDTHIHASRSGAKWV